MKKVKLKPNSFEIPIDIYGFSIFVVFNQPSLLRETLKNYKYKMSSEDIESLVISLEEVDKQKYCAKCFKLENGNCLIYLSNYTYYNIPTLLASVVHESLHATHFILDYIGMNLTDETSEAYCYLQDYICESIFNKILNV